MRPMPCRVRSLAPEPATEAAGTIGIEPADGGIVRVTTARPGLVVSAVLSRDEATAFLLAGAEALGMVLLDPRAAARRRAENLKRGQRRR
jgi:hypothetical protein